MVKAIPKQQDRLTRRRRKYIKLQHQNHKESDSLLLCLKMATSPTHLLQHATNPTFKTPPPFPKKRPCSCSSSSTSPSYSPSTYGTCSSSSPPMSPSTLSSPSFLHSVSSPATTAKTHSHQPQFLRRTISDPPVFSSDSTSNSKKMMEILQELAASSSPPVSRNLMGQLLPPLPPSPSPKLLRRTVSDPVTLSSDRKTSAAKENERAKMKEQMVKAEKLSGDWTMIKLNCGCGSDFKFLFCGTDSKCYKLV